MSYIQTYTYTKKYTCRYFNMVTFIQWWSKSGLLKCWHPYKKNFNSATIVCYCYTYSNIKLFPHCLPSCILIDTWVTTHRCIYIHTFLYNISMVLPVLYVYTRRSYMHIILQKFNDDSRLLVPCGLWCIFFRTHIKRERTFLCR